MSADELQSVGTLRSPATPGVDRPPVQLTDLGPSRTERILDRGELGLRRRRRLNRRLEPYRLVVFAVVGVCLLVAGIHAVGTGQQAKLPAHEAIGTVSNLGFGQRGADSVSEVTVTYVIPHYGQHDLLTSTDNFNEYGEGEQLIVAYVPGEPLSAHIVSRYTPKSGPGGIVVIFLGAILLVSSMGMLVQLWIRRRKNRDRTWSPTPLT